MSNVAKHSHVTSYLSNKAGEAKEANTKWYRDNPGKQPGYGSKTWASYSHVRYPSESFRRGYDSIQWS